MKMLITDLDGTLLNNENGVSEQDFDTLVQLGRKNILRVIATGRSYYSVQKVLPPDSPIDFIILSSGIGIMDWQSKQLIATHTIDEKRIKRTIPLLQKNQIDFMLHAPLPDNHYFVYFKNSHTNKDFNRRLELYEKFAKPLQNASSINDAASQFVCVFPEHEHFPKDLNTEITGLNLVRATSPLDHKSNWYELYPAQVSKAKAAGFLANKFGIDSKDAVALGNDYNDWDLLDWAGSPFVVKNAPEELKSIYPVTLSNNQSALSQVVKHALRENNTQRM